MRLGSTPGGRSSKFGVATCRAARSRPRTRSTRQLPAAFPLLFRFPVVTAPGIMPEFPHARLAASLPQSRARTPRPGRGLASVHADEGSRVAAHDPDSRRDRKSTRLNSSHLGISYAVFCLKKKRFEA